MSSMLLTEWEKFTKSQRHLEWLLEEESLEWLIEEENLGAFRRIFLSVDSGLWLSILSVWRKASASDGSWNVSWSPLWDRKHRIKQNIYSKMLYVCVKPPRTSPQRGESYNHHLWVNGFGDIFEGLSIYQHSWNIWQWCRAFTCICTHAVSLLCSTRCVSVQGYPHKPPECTL